MSGDEATGETFIDHGGLERPTVGWAIGISLGLLVSATGCANEVDDSEGPVGQVQSDIINGTANPVDYLGTPYVALTDPMLTGHCSGTLIRGDWLLTAHHCVSQNAAVSGGTAILPSELSVSVLGGYNNPISGLHIVRHPSLDVALVKLTTAPLGNTSMYSSRIPYRNWIYQGSDASLVSQSLYSQGWGSNALTSCTPPTVGSTGSGTLRWAYLPITATLGSTEFEVQNTGGPSQPMAAPGDSGSAIFTQVSGYYVPMGVASNIGCSGSPLEVTEADYTRSDAFRGWFQGVVGWAPRVGNGIGYERGDGLNAVNYIDSNGHAKEILNHGGGVYGLTDLSGGGQPAIRGSVLSSGVRTDGVNAVTYEGADTNIYQAYAIGSSWGLYNLTAAVGLPGALGSPSTYVRADNTDAVLYVASTNNHVYEIRLPSGGTAWLSADLTAAAGAPGASLSAIGYVRADGVNAAVYTATTGHVIELAQNGSGWAMTDLTAASGAPIAAGQARPYTREDGYSSVVFRASNGDIWEMFRAFDGQTWGSGDLTASAGCPSASSDPSPSVRIDNWNSVLFLDSNLHAQEISLPPGSGWSCHDLTAISGAPPSVTVPGGFIGGDELSYVITTAAGGHIWALNLNSPGTNSWSKFDLTAHAGGP